MDVKSFISALNQTMHDVVLIYVILINAVAPTKKVMTPQTQNVG
jgi:hypothetical protein